MRSCKEVSTRASALIDGELGLWDAFQMRLHLAMCKGCSRFIDQLRVSRDLTMIAPEPSELDEFDDARITELFSRLHDEKQPKG